MKVFTGPFAELLQANEQLQRLIAAIPLLDTLRLHHESQAKGPYPASAQYHAELAQKIRTVLNR